MTSLEAELSAATSESPLDSLSVSYSQIPAIPATALWPGVIPNRTPVLWVAPGGTGKGMAIAAVAGITTSGRNFPGCEPVEPGQVLMVSPEDDPNEDMAFRLRAAGANLDLVRDLTILPNGDPFMLPSDEQYLREAIEEANEDEGKPPVKLVTIDPLYCIAENGLTSPKLTRRLWIMLQDVARDNGIAMIVSHHTTKDSRVVAGSKQLTDAARMVWMINKAQDNPDARTMTVFKSNRKTANDPRYVIAGDDEDAHAVFTGPETVVKGSRAARMRLDQMPKPREPEEDGKPEETGKPSPEEIARQWLEDHPDPAQDSKREEKAAA